MKIISSATILQVKKELRRLHEDVVDACYTEDMKELIRTKTFFAGGCVRDLQRGKQPKDYDLFFYTKEDAAFFAIEVKKNFAFKATALENYNIKIIEKKVQVITVTSGMPDELTKSFDFTINTGVYCPQIDTLKLGQADNILIACESINSPLNALARVAKFVEAGYKVDATCLVKLGAAVSKMEPLDTEEKILEALKGISASVLLTQSYSDDIPF